MINYLIGTGSVAALAIFSLGGGTNDIDRSASTLTSSECTSASITLQQTAATATVAPMAQMVTANTDVIGAYLYRRTADGDQREQVLHLIWGLTKDRALGYAALSTIDDEGNRFDYENFDAFPTLIFDASELRDFRYLADSEHGHIHMDEMRYFVDTLGMLRTMHAVGTGFDGQAFEFGHQSLSAALASSVEECCQAAELVRCIDDSDATPVCSAAGDGDTWTCQGTKDCKCVDGEGNSGGGGCVLKTTKKCEGACGGDCPGDIASCKQIGITPFRCDCVPPVGGGDQ